MDKVIILDCGHGGINPMTGKYVTAGKRSPKWSDGSQYFEGEGNRIIAKIAEQYLIKLGWKVLFTVDPNGWIDTPLRDRIAYSNEYYKEHPSVFQISIHSNGFSKESANGAEVFTSKNCSKLSADIARWWYLEHTDLFPSLKWRGFKKANLAMNRVNCPSILIETMFHTNEKECRILMSDEGKEKIAIAIVETCERVNENRTK